MLLDERCAPPRGPRHCPRLAVPLRPRAVSNRGAPRRSPRTTRCHATSRRPPRPHGATSSARPLPRERSRDPSPSLPPRASPRACSVPRCPPRVAPWRWNAPCTPTLRRRIPCGGPCSRSSQMTPTLRRRPGCAAPRAAGRHRRPRPSPVGSSTRFPPAAERANRPTGSLGSTRRPSDRATRPCASRAAAGDPLRAPGQEPSPPGSSSPGRPLRS